MAKGSIFSMQNHDYDDFDFEVFPWNADLETGIEIIDEQHKQLVALLNKLARCLVNNKSLEITSVFNELASYAEMHFRCEEGIWAKAFADDSWNKAHQQIHQSFLPEVEQIQNELQDAPQAEVTEQVLSFLIRWLSFHIIDSDKRMAYVVSEVNAGASLADAKQRADEKMENSMILLVNIIMNMHDEMAHRTIALMKEKQAREETDVKLHQTSTALDSATRQLEELKDIIPICSYCHDIRTDEGAWSQIDRYIQKNSNIKFSHGICPECLKKQRAELGLEE